MKITTCQAVLIKTITLLALGAFPNLGFAQQDVTFDKNKFVVHLPAGDLNFVTNFNAHSTEGWKPAKLEEQTNPGDNEINLSLSFEDGETLEASRKFTIDGGLIKGTDRYVPSTDIVGHIHYDITLPMEDSSDTIIQTDTGEISLADASVTDIEYFLRSEALESLTIKNYLGANIKVTFPPARFEIMAFPPRRIIHLRMYVTPDRSLITGFDSDWTIEVSPSE